MRWLVKTAGRVRKRFARSPHWARDILGLVSYVNFIELIPSLVAIAVAPRHFFRRLPMTLRGHRPLFQTPVKFFFNFAALFLFLFFLRHADLPSVIQEQHAIWYLPLMIPLTPPCMFGLGIITLFLYQLPRLAPNGDAFPPPNGGAFKLLLSPQTYLNLDSGRFFWGLFYISGYFVAAWQVVQVLVALIFLGIVHVSSALGEGHAIPKLIVSLLGVAIAALSIHGLVLHPYIEMLRASLRRPTRAIYEIDVHEIAQIVKAYLALPGSESTLDTSANTLFKAISEETDVLHRVIAQQNVDFELSEDDALERIRVHRDALSIKALRDRLADTSPIVRGKFDVLLSRFDPSAGDVRRTAA
ncbi:MAG: hypothetical protein AAGD07_09070 [Planctomycetota bacterium]